MPDNQVDIGAAEVMGSALVDAGLMSAADVASDLAAMRGEPAIDPAPSTTAPPAAGRELAASDEPDAISEAAFLPPARASLYDLSLPYGVTLSASDAAEVTTIKAAFHTAGLPASIVAEFGRQAAAAAANPPSDLERASMQARTLAKLKEMHGDNLDAVLKVARAEYRTLLAAAPTLERMAERSGLADSVYLIQSLYGNARSKKRA